MQGNKTVDDVFMADENMTYDAAAKSFLANKVILARILKHCVKEFADCDLKDIEEKYIEGTPEVNLIPLATDRTNAAKKITGDNVEYRTVTEGETTFDIRFVAYAPTTGEPIKLIINLEAQKKSNPSYSLIKRAMFHCSRLISSQYNVEFVEPNFDDIKKVVSIWIVMNSPIKNRNCITQYRVVEEQVVGKAKDAEKNYDLQRAVMLYLGNYEKIDDELLRMLDLVFRAKLDAEQKKSRLKSEFDIELDSKMEGALNNMGRDLLEGILESYYDEAREEGHEKGREEMREQTVLNMLKEKISEDVISRVLDLPIEKITALGKLNGLL